MTPYHYLSSLSLCEYVGIRPRYHETTNIGGSSFIAHVRHAAAAISAGMCEVALVTYASSQRSDGRSLVTSAEKTNFEIPYGPLYPASQFALIAQRYMHEFGATAEDLARVAVATAPGRR